MSEVSFLTEARIGLAKFCTELGIFVPDPTPYRLIDPDADYTPEQLRALLQRFGAYISSLTAFFGKLESEHSLMEKNYKLSRKIMMGRYDGPSTTTLAERESQLLNTDQGQELIRLEQDVIRSESSIIVVKSWINSYESAYTSISRVVAVMESEANSTGGNQRFT